MWTKALLTAARDTNILTKPLDKVIVAYSQYQPIYDEIASLYSDDPAKLELTTQVPWDELNELDGTKNTLVWLDDLMLDYGWYNCIWLISVVTMNVSANDKRLSDLFTKGRHRGISILFSVQNFYVKGSVMSNITRYLYLY